MTGQENSGKKEPTISEYMTRNVSTIPGDATLMELSQAFIKQHVSALLVTDNNDYVGIVSDKRLAREGVAKGLNVETTPVKAIMRSKMLQIESHQPIREAQAMMKAHDVRHLVVTEGGKIVGIVTINDLIRYFTDFFEG